MDIALFQAAWTQAWPWITAVIAIASALDAALPQPKPGSHWIIPRKILSFVAVNVANASNGKQPDFVTWIVRVAAPALQAKALAADPASAEPIPSQPAPQPVAVPPQQ